MPLLPAFFLLYPFSLLLSAPLSFFDSCVSPASARVAPRRRYAAMRHTSRRRSDAAAARCSAPDDDAAVFLTTMPRCPPRLCRCRRRSPAAIFRCHLRPLRRRLPVEAACADAAFRRLATRPLCRFAPPPPPAAATRDAPCLMPLPCSHASRLPACSPRPAFS